MPNIEITPYIGVGLRAKYFRDILEQPPSCLGWLEVHPENYFGGGKHVSLLEEVRINYPLSLHAVGLSLGSDQPVNEQHLKQLKKLISQFEPFLVSDHASWSASGNAHLNDLFPLPYTQDTLNILSQNVAFTQDYLGRQILIENPSTYISYAIDEMSETTFLNQLTLHTGCGLLLDINNVYVQSVNHAFNPYTYIDDLNVKAVQEIHLAGHTQRKLQDGILLIDTHNQQVCQSVWDLYRYAITKIGLCHTLIEWDSDLPDLAELLSEAHKAKLVMQEVMTNAA